jgi:hypothetical protein
VRSGDDERAGARPPYSPAMSSSGKVYVKAGAAVAGASVGAVRVLIRSNFDLKWFRIAVEHERAALEARDRAVAAPDGSPEMGEAFDDELRAAMVTVTAAAFAIDALYHTIDDLLTEAERSRAKRDVGRIVETFKNTLELGGRGQAWQASIAALFALRGDLAHFRGEDHEPQPHPTGKSNVSLENVIYTAEEATRAVDLALEVLTVAYTSPRKQHAALVERAEGGAGVAAWLEDERRKFS